MENMVVKKDNYIIQSTKNKFSYNENKLMCVLLGRYINKKENDCIDTTVSVAEFMQLLGYTSDGSKNYKTVRNAVDQLGESSSIGLYNATKNKYVWLPFFKKIELDENEVTFTWNDLMKPHLTNLDNGRWTAYLSEDYLQLNTKRGQDFYELCKSWQTKGSFEVSVTELKRILDADQESYKQYKIFKAMCLNKVLNDINDNTDLQVEISRQAKKGRNIERLTFSVKQKNKKIRYGSKNNLWMTEEEINDIVMNRHAKWILNEVSNWKYENPDKYKHYKKSDYEICLEWIKKNSMDL